MNIQQMKYVIEVEKTGSITKAAANLFMGQPNLSKSIKDLENEIGVTIFRRTAKGVVPTPRGGEFLTYAKQIISQIDELESLYHKSYDKSINLHISVPRSTYIAVAFADFLNKTGLAAKQNRIQMQLHYKETNAMTGISDVASGESKIGIIRYQNPYDEYFSAMIADHGLKSILVKEYTLSIIMSDSHPLAGYALIPFHELSSYTEIVHGDYQVPSLSFSQLKKNAEMDAPLKQIFVYDRGSQYDLLQSIPGSFMWVSPVPQVSLRQKNLVLKPCDAAGVINKDVLIFQKGHKFSHYETCFLNELGLQL